MLPTPFVHILCLSTFSLVAAATCYDRTGAVMDATSYFPCDNTTTFSSCCLLHQDNGGPSDVCTSSGLCLRQDSIPGFFYIDGCTDKSWESSSCPKFCSNNSQSVVQSCSDTGTGTWCCRAEGEASCCSNAFETDVGVLLLPTVTISVSGTVTAASIGSNSPSATCSSSVCPQPGKDKSGVVGGAVGAVLGVALLASLGMLAWRERTRPKYAAVPMAYSGSYDDRSHSTKQIGVQPAPFEVGLGERHELESRPK